MFPRDLRVPSRPWVIDAVSCGHAKAEHPTTACGCSSSPKPTEKDPVLAKPYIGKTSFHDDCRK